jgi:hypothetical protein
LKPKSHDFIIFLQRLNIRKQLEEQIAHTDFEIKAVDPSNKRLAIQDKTQLILLD